MLSEVAILKSKGKLNKSLVEKNELRTNLVSLDKNLKNIKKANFIKIPLQDLDVLKEEKDKLEHYINFVPLWVLFLISISLGVGTMIGYKRIVETLGGKIGKTHLTYGQGATSEIIAAITIGLSTNFGLPVSTTHVLSSAIAGSMVATGGVNNLHKGTIKNIIWAWVLTLPVTILVAIILFVIFRLILV